MMNWKVLGKKRSSHDGGTIPELGCEGLMNSMETSVKSPDRESSRALPDASLRASPLCKPAWWYSYDEIITVIIIIIIIIHCCGVDFTYEPCETARTSVTPGFCGCTLLHAYNSFHIFLCYL
jgi:hypothetical protein